jgi:hypothetical protein
MQNFSHSIDVLPLLLYDDVCNLHDRRKEEQEYFTKAKLSHYRPVQASNGIAPAAFTPGDKPGTHSC